MSTSDHPPDRNGDRIAAIQRAVGVLLPMLILAFAALVYPTDRAIAAGSWPGDAYVLRVDGLACPYCGYGVEKQFSRREGVEATDINIERGVVIVTVAPDTRLSDGELQRIIRESGFTLSEIVQRPTGE